MTLKTKIVIPTYNEAENIEKLIPQVLGLALPEAGVLIVDDNSPDGTGEMVEAMKSQYPGRIDCLHRQGKMGLGTAYITGFQWCIAEGYDFIGQMDADFSHPPEKLVEFYQSMNGYDAVFGSRYIPGGRLDDRWPIWRKTLSTFGNIYARTILGLPIKDITGGFKLWKKETLAGMPLSDIKSNGYIFQVEMAYAATKLGYKVKEVPFYFADRRWGKSKMSIRIQLEAAIRVWQLLWMYRKMKPSDRKPIS